jgi:hypothetical protein
MCSSVHISTSRKSLAISKNVPFSGILTGRKDKFEKNVDKIGDKRRPGHKSYFGDCPRKSGTNDHLVL